MDIVLYFAINHDFVLRSNMQFYAFLARLTKIYYISLFL